MVAGMIVVSITLWLLTLTSEHFPLLHEAKLAIMCAFKFDFQSSKFWKGYDYGCQKMTLRGLIPTEEGIFVLASICRVKCMFTNICNHVCIQIQFHPVNYILMVADMIHITTVAKTCKWWGLRCLSFVSYFMLWAVIFTQNLQSTLHLYVI